MKFAAITIDAIPYGRPLPFPLHNERGVLLAQQGTVIASRPALMALYGGRTLYMGLPDMNPAKVLNLIGMLEHEQVTIGEIAESQWGDDEDDFQPLSTHTSAAVVDWTDLRARANWILRDTKGRDVLVRMHALHADLLQRCERNPDQALMSLIYLASTDTTHYSAMHALLLTVMCTLTAARVLRWPHEEVIAVGRAALTKNLALTDVQDRLAVQMSGPDSEQRERILHHERQAVQILHEIGVSSPLWLDAVRLHREAQPGRLGSRDPAERMARLIRRADIFGARIAPRATRAGLTPKAAMQATYFDEDQRTDEAGAALIKAIGVYPPGTFVKLASGETGIVVRRDNLTTMPRVAVLLNRHGEPVTEPIGRNTGLNNFRVKSTLAASDVRVNFDLARAASVA